MRARRHRNCVAIMCFGGCRMRNRPAGGRPWWETAWMNLATIVERQKKDRFYGKYLPVALAAVGCVAAIGIMIASADLSTQRSAWEHDKSAREQVMAESGWPALWARPRVARPRACRLVQPQLPA